MPIDGLTLEDWIDSVAGLIERGLGILADPVAADWTDQHLQGTPQAPLVVLTRRPTAMAWLS
jgi:hypothetical protein